jgi:hypothetical protein
MCPDGFRVCDLGVVMPQYKSLYLPSQSGALFGRRMFKRELSISLLLNFDHECHSSFRAAEWERLADVLVRDGVHVPEIAIRTALDYSTTKLGFLVGIVEINDRERDTRIAPRVLRLERAFSVQIRIRSPSRPTQTGTLWGEPSGIKVARWAKLGSSSKALTSLESCNAIRNVLVAVLRHDLTKGA